MALPARALLSWPIVITLGAAALILLLAQRAPSADAALVVLPRATQELPAGNDHQRTVVLAGGCFWCEEAVFEQLKGVSTVVAGYAGGTQATANYEHYTESNHAEAVRITYDPQVIGFTELLRVLFTAGDPTTKDGQDPDYGHQYRMAIFVQNAQERAIAQGYLDQLTAAHCYDRPLAVTIEDLEGRFYPAEDYHQHYVAEHPDQPYCRRYSLAKIRRIRAAFADELKPSPAATPP